MDVDGVLTDGGIVWSASAHGELIESKSFNVRDGLALSLASTAGFEVAWITGRVSPIVLKRAEELAVPHVCQRSRDKRRVLHDLARRLGLRSEGVLYLGDDLNDLPAFDEAGVRVAVADAALEVRARANWITGAPGGRGAVREVVEGVLKAQDRWNEAIAGFLARLRDEQERPLQ
jgi:3-deoxy-D-manno-octulosonate 8-phosphate phosphatase (KDO 8-P phosphatase)